MQWCLLTTEPIDTAEQLWAAIVDAYRARWVIEEYFKALKTGCAYEKRQFESDRTLLRVMALFVPVAWWLLMLRTVTRAEPQQPATKVLSPLQLHCLRAALRKLKVTLSAEPCVADVLRGIARLGGHIARNGDPGWIVLRLGLSKLLLQYRRNGTANLFVFLDAHRGWREVKGTDHRAGIDFAECMRDLVPSHSDFDGL